MNRLKHAHMETPRTSKKQPLTEEITRASYTNEEIGLIKSQRELLIKKDLNDEAISIELSKHLDHSANSIREKIRFLIKASQLPENPNKQEHEGFAVQDLQTIISQRSLLIAKNLTDGEISRELSKLIGHSAGSINAKIRQLVKSGQLPENPNKQEHKVFTDQEIQTIISQRSLLIAKNITDKEISREVSKQLNRSAGGIKEKIRSLVKSAQLPYNPNTKEQVGFSEQELQTITSQRPSLIAKNLTDQEISRELSKQLNRSGGGMSEKIYRLVKSAQLPENPNKKELVGFSEQEIQAIISQRSLLIAKNLADGEISRELSKQLNRSAGSIKAKIRQLVKSAQLPYNPNTKEQVGFSEQELQTITSQRPLLIAKNLNDYEISRELSKLIDHPVKSIEEKIRNLVKSGQLPENPNKQEHKVFTDQELQTITSQRSSLIAKNLTDKEISRELSKLIDRPAEGISHKIRKLIKSGKLPENPNKLGRKPTENELLIQLVNAVDAYTGEKNE